MTHCAPKRIRFADQYPRSKHKRNIVWYLYGGVRGDSDGVLARVENAVTLGAAGAIAIGTPASQFLTAGADQV